MTVLARFHRSYADAYASKRSDARERGMHAHREVNCVLRELAAAITVVFSSR